ncbi:type 4a pilus biogenesis protein PilO [Aciditerrimonas ferrireducens]|jgi:Tfp pilus assembly protein PilO|uniref:Type 4a pilus biogenesis protein PilO n=1 Tax=Aciditerrimonas ferrireducens TaxID=667306 RepID=A0ABV6C397_9ACTN|nr:type 4a pilus biogenesis protein PilO [Aciditerrimonas ferrireducens]MCK4176541.1 type 4a pilus biogenesis protein PilO [Aciditerrimonas ferrireducens]
MTELRAHLHPYRHVLLVTLVAVVVLVAALLAWVLPEGRHAAQLQATRQELSAQEQALQAELLALEHDQHQQVLNCQSYSRFVAEIPPALDESQFVLDVGALASASGAPSIPSLTWGSASTQDGLQTVQVTLTLVGTFGQVMNFVKGLDGSAFPRLFTVSSFAVNLAGQGQGTPSSSSGGSSAGAVVVGTSLAPASSPGYEVKVTGQIYDDPGEQDPCSASTTASGGTAGAAAAG